MLNELDIFIIIFVLKLIGSLFWDKCSGALSLLFLEKGKCIYLPTIDKWLYFQGKQLSFVGTGDRPFEKNNLKEK
jgi:hypothetical protein